MLLCNYRCYIKPIILERKNEENSNTHTSTHQHIFIIKIFTLHNVSLV